MISKGLLHINNVILVEDISIFSDHTPVVFLLGDIDLHVAPSNSNDKNVDNESTNPFGFLNGTQTANQFLL